ncbi:putative LTR copia-type gag-polypeptide [Tanacetum coccineum]
MAALTTKIRHITQTITAAFRHQPPAAACTICMEELVVKGDTNIKQLPCRHKFHASCIRDWLYLKQTCPICRYKIDDQFMLVNTHLRVSFKEFKRSKFLWVYQLRELIDALFPESMSAHPILHNLFKSSIQATMFGEATKSGDKLQTFNLHVKANDIKENKTHLTCSNCGMSRHTTHQCFELIGYPDWWNDGHKKGNKNRGLERGKASAANTGTDRKNSTGLGGMAATTVNEEDGSFSMSTTQNYNINKKQSWIFDCGATYTMTYDLSDFATSTKPTKSYIHTANGE